MLVYKEKKKSVWSRINFHGLKPPFYSYMRILCKKRDKNQEGKARMEGSGDSGGETHTEREMGTSV